MWNECAETDFFSEYASVVVKNKQVVTLFMLTHNRENLVILSIDSVLRQTYSNFQLIVLDNESTDNTEKVIKGINDGRVHYLFRKSTIGDSNTEFARNICQTKYFVILHDDDILEANYLKNIVDIMENHDYDAMSVSAYIIDENGKRKGEWTKRTLTDTRWSNGDYLRQYLSKDGISMIYPAVIYRHSFYKNFPMFGGDIKAGPSGDQVIWFQTEKMGGVLGLHNEYLFNYRRHSNQESNINIGFMTFQLFDYLLDDSFYKSILLNDYRLVYFKVWKAFKAVTKRYCVGAINDLKYKSIFEYKIMETIYLQPVGRIFYLWLRLLYTGRKIIRFAIMRKSYEISRK